MKTSDPFHLQKAIRKHLLPALLLAIVLLAPIRAFAATPKNMQLNTSCYIYKNPSATTANRDAYLTFGTSVTVKSMTDKWVTITYSGATRYISRSNVEYIYRTVSKARVNVRTGVTTTSAGTTAGTALYAEELQVLGTVTSGSSKYLKCVIPKLYDANGKKVIATNKTGYIFYNYTEEAGVPKVINSGCKLYKKPDTTATAISVSTGASLTNLKVGSSLTNKSGSWARVRYNGSIYYAIPTRLDPVVIQVTAKKIPQYKEAKTTATVLHYLYWNAEVEVLGTLENSASGTYYYCEAFGDLGFVRAASTTTKYLGYNTTMEAAKNCAVYESASSTSTKVGTVLLNNTCTVEYMGSSWARVSTDKFTGYCTLANLAYPKATITGPWYANSYRMNIDSPAGTWTGKSVSIIAQNTAYGFACVIPEGSTAKYFVKLSSVVMKEEATAKAYTIDAFTTLHRSANAEPQDTDVKIPYNTELIIYPDSVSTGSEGSWQKVQYEGTVYYMWIAKGTTELRSTPSDLTAYTSDNKYQQEMIDMILQILARGNNGYAHKKSTGEADPDGIYYFDCSGFASYVLDTVMRKHVPTYDVTSTLPILYETEVIYNTGIKGEFSAQNVSEDDMQPGDVLFFALDKDEADSTYDAATIAAMDGTTHCGVYLGKGEFVHCTQSWGGTIIIMPLTGIYKEKLVRIKRCVPTSITAADMTLYTYGYANIKLYDSMSTEGNVKQTIPAETPVTLRYTNASGTWSYVRLEDGTKGFIWSANLTDSITETSETRYLKTTRNIYSVASTDESALAFSLAPETQVEYLGRYSTTNFYKVRYEGTVYYMYAADGIDEYLTTEAPVSESKTMYLTATRNVRTEPSSSAESFSLIKDTEVTYVGRYGTSNWYKIIYEGTMYYLYADEGLYQYLTEEAPAEISVTMQFTTGRNVHIAPKVDSATAVSLSKGTVVEYVGQYGTTSWYKIMYNGNLYYLYSPEGINQYLTEV